MRHRRALRRALVVVVALGLATAVTACAASSDEPAANAVTHTGGGPPPPVPGFDGRAIHVGALTALTGPESLIGLPATAGATAYFQSLNTETGGIDGKYQVVLDVRDTAGQPAQAATAYAALQPTSVVFGQVLGEQVVEGLLPHLRSDRMVAAPVLAADDLRDPNLLPTGVPVGVQAANGLEWYLAGRPQPGTICSLVQQDAWGDAGQAGLAQAAAQHHLTLGPEARVPAPPPEPGGLDAPLGQLRGAHCAVVFLMAAPAAATAALTQASAAAFAPRWIAVAGSWTTTLATSPIADYVKAHLTVVSEGPAWGDGRLDAVREVNRIRLAYTPGALPDTWFRYGYLQAEAVAALLAKAVALGDLSHDGILAASRALGRVSLSGVAGAFTYGPPDRRVPPTTSAIDGVDPSDPAGLVVEVASVRAPYADQLLH